MKARMLLLAAVAIGPIAGCGGGGTNSDLRLVEQPNLRGQITDIDDVQNPPLPGETKNNGVRGRDYLMVDGGPSASSSIEKALVTVDDETLVYRKTPDGLETIVTDRRPDMEPYKVGQEVIVTFADPVVMTDPPQAKAKKLVILPDTTP